MELSPRERSTLRAVCDTLFPSLDGESTFERRSASDLSVDILLEEAIDNSLQPGNAKDLRRVISVFDSPLYNFVLSGRPSKFSQLPPEERERYLARWRDSPLALKRTTFQAFKRLTLFLAYTSTADDGLNPNWQDIGYPGPSKEPASPVPSDLLLSPLAPQEDAKFECDVAVVGSGAGGSVIAQELASSGFKVLVVEAGPYETSETFRQSELPMMQKLFQQSGTAATKDLSFVLLAGRGAGGGTTVNWNTCLKPPRRALAEWESEFGIDGVGGERFASYLEEVWGAIGVNPLESQRNENNQVLWDGCTALGYSQGTDFHVIERNAVSCDQRCDYCTYGCRYGCKQSTAVTYLPRAQRSGARFLFDTRVERVVVVDGAARGLTATRSAGGRSFKIDVRARAVVVACGAVETPALLLRSGVKDRNVGNFLRLDPTVAVGGVFDRPIEPWKGPPQTVAVWKFLDLEGAFHGFWVEAAPAHPGLAALTVPWQSGRDHKDFMKNYFARSSASIVLLRERSWGRVSIDRMGFPAVTYDLVREDRETLMHGMEETARILADAGATGIWTTHNDPVFVGDGRRKLSASDVDQFGQQVKQRGVEYNRMMLFSAHLMGACRMSSDPSMGPVAPSGELHEVKNLFVGDASVFPTTPGVNPMISIMAMSRRTAESIKAALKPAS